MYYFSSVNRIILCFFTTEWFISLTELGCYSAGVLLEEHDLSHSLIWCELSSKHVPSSHKWRQDSEAAKSAMSHNSSFFECLLKYRRSVHTTWTKVKNKEKFTKGNVELFHSKLERNYYIAPVPCVFCVFCFYII